MASLMAPLMDGMREFVRVCLTGSSMEHSMDFELVKVLLKVTLRVP